MRLLIFSACVGLCSVLAFSQFEYAYATVAGLWILLLISLVKRPRSILSVALLVLILTQLFTLYRLEAALGHKLSYAEQGTQHELELQILTTPHMDEQGQIRFDARVLGSDELKGLRRIRVSWREPLAMPQCGERWLFKLRLKRPRGQASPGAFDYEAYLLRHGIDAKARVLKSKAQRLSAAEGFCLESYRAEIRDHILRSDSPYAGLVLALALADTSEISEPQWDVLRRSGTVHLFVVSGLHLGLVAAVLWAVCFALLGLLRRHNVSVFHWSLLLALIGASAYGALCGFSMPIQRALVMLWLGGLSAFMGWRLRPSLIFLLALLAVLLIDPLVVISRGFYYAFLSVGVLLWTFSNRRDAPTKLASIVKAQLAILAVVLPLSLYYAESFNLFSPVANALLIPLVGLLLVPSLLFAILCMPILPALADWIVLAVEYVLELMLNGLTLMLSLDHGLVLSALTPAQLVLLLGLLFIALLPRSLRLRMPMLGLALLLIFARREPSGEMEIAVLDVSQGLSVVLSYAGQSLIFDTGTRYSPRFNMAEAVVLPYMKRRTLPDPRLLMISHEDLDHSGGVQALSKRFEGLQTMQGGADTIHLAQSLCLRGQSWIWPGFGSGSGLDMSDARTLRLDVLWGAQEGYLGNDASCVLLIRFAGQSILLAGDITAEVEPQVLKRVAPFVPQGERIDLLVAPHHGSLSSSTWPFVKALRPRMVAISAGFANSFGHPHEAVVRRYQSLSAQLDNTADSGTLRYQLDESGKLKLINAYRVSNRRLWW